MVDHIHLLVSITTEVQYIKFHGVSEREECIDDL